MYLYGSKNTLSLNLTLTVSNKDFTSLADADEGRQPIMAHVCTFPSQFDLWQYLDGGYLMAGSCKIF